MPTPLYDSLRALASGDLLRLDMPGHHGAALPGGFPWPAGLDFTENGSTGDLFGEAPDQIQAAERLWAERFGFDACLFLTGGSTQGVHTGLALLAGQGSAIALDRGSHRSAYHALALLDLAPHFLPRPWLAEEGIAGPIPPEAVGKALDAHPEINTVCITSPTYYGVLSDIPAIAAACHAHGAKLMVDGAHGAHLPFLGYTGYQAADAVVVSAHKTLPAPGQTALLFANGFGLGELQRWGSVYGSSSPSYVLMSALDAVRDYMAGEGTARYQSTARLTDGLRRRWPALRAGLPLDPTRLTLHSFSTPDLIWSASYDSGYLSLDPTRLTLYSSDGFALAQALRERGVYVEMAGRGHVVCIFTCADGEAEFARLEQALEDTGLTGHAAPCPPPPEPPRPVLTPRQALFAPRERVLLSDSAGRICAGQIAPYPPGVPVVAPGERIEKKYLAYLREIGYNKIYCDVIREV